MFSESSSSTTISGRSFTLYEDHKQMVSLFNKKSAILAQVSNQNTKMGLELGSLSLCAGIYDHSPEGECQCYESVTITVSL